DIQTLISEPDHASSSPLISPGSSSVSHCIQISNSLLRYLRKSLPPALPPPPALVECVVLYFTSLHVMRRSYEDCRTVRSILCGIRAPTDERDLSMDVKYLDELQKILPVVLIGEKCIVGGRRRM
ncbi:Uncharacterized protein At5g39865, partial [Linum grandiflorum]